MCHVDFHPPLCEIRESLGVVHKMSNMMRCFCNTLALETAHRTLLYYTLGFMILTFTDSTVVDKENTNCVFVPFDLFLFVYYVNVLTSLRKVKST